jgi:oxamate amidohydrolase
VPEEVARDLAGRGHPIERLAGWDPAAGLIHAIRINGDTGLFEGGADPRGVGAAVGF